MSTYESKSQYKTFLNFVPPVFSLVKTLHLISSRVLNVDVIWLVIFSPRLQIYDCTKI